ncbi:MAG: polyphosphate polymerase domain-containing protein [Planctomycetes bacterium]|nr:polyphosphate polymerase domain-containing protein [Planctomycetota bacterium]
MSFKIKKNKQTHLHFHRYEFKYILPLHLRQALEGELLHFMTLDPYVKGPEGGYFVRSLYYDNDIYNEYYDKTEGLHTRAKFRIRTYTRDPQENCVVFLENKGRRDGMVFKDRMQAPMSISPDFPHYEDLTPYFMKESNASPVLEKFQFQVYRKRIKPKVLIDYFRRPYVSQFDRDFRVTFDEKLMATASSSLFPKDQGSSRLLIDGHSVMEIKFRRHIPAWFHRIIQSYELRRISISKVCKGMESFNMTPAYEG